MNSKITRAASVLAAVTFWFIALPVHPVLAVSGQLNLNTSEPQVAPMPSMFGLFLRLIVSLVVIVGLAYLTMRLLRKNMKFLAGGTSINVLDQFSISVNKGVYITRIAGRVYVLGVTDHNINVITEITDRDTIDELVRKSEERAAEPIIPPSILERILPVSLKGNSSQNKSFNVHIQKQIRKLQSMVENRGGKSREDDKND